jgi:pyocin large subunit-like protein
MSWQAMDTVYTMDIADPVAKFVLITIAKHADERLQCWPSVSRISSLTGLSSRTVQRKVAELKKMGVLYVTTRGRKGEQSSNLYLIKVPKGVRQRDAKPRQSVTPNTSECHPNRSMNNSELSLSVKSSKKENSSGEVDWSGFGPAK